jgi:hypothetical protein
VAYVKDADFLRGVIDLVQDSVLPDSDSPTFVQFPVEPLCPRWARGRSQGEDCFIQSLDNRFWEVFDLPDSARIDEYAVSHNFPARFRRSRTLS